MAVWSAFDAGVVPGLALSLVAATGAAGRGAGADGVLEAGRLAGRLCRRRRHYSKTGSMPAAQPRRCQVSASILLPFQPL